MSLVVMIVACGLITFLIRLSFIAGGRALPQSSRLQALLRYVPPAVLAALITPEIFVQQNALFFDVSNLRMWAAIIALLAAYFTQNVLVTIAAGMVALWCLQAL